ncbi:MAG TPA: hypothetical protein VF746_25045 [Longimicrobium sp.]|jgi:FtsP/CotA-like multicopper oxidase with cupredoxin domain
MLRSIRPGTISLLALCGALGLAACGDSAPGTVVGDAYIVLETGQEVSFGGLRVGLVPEDEALDTMLARLCPRRDAAAGADSAARETAWGRRAQLLSQRARRTVTATAAAQFFIDTVAPGEYRVWADTAYGGTRWTWLQPVRVRSGDTVRVNLSNANPDENPFRCPSE